MTTAVVEPRTLAAAFNDQAHRMDGGCSSSNRRRPQGNGIPIKNAAGKIDAAVTTILAGSGQVTTAPARGVALKARRATNAKIEARTAISRLSLPVTRRLK